MRHVDRRAGRAHKINELELKRDSIVTPTELAVVFGGLIKLLREHLDDKTFRALLPKVQALAGALRPGVVGSAAELVRQPDVHLEPAGRGAVGGMKTG